MSQQLSDKQIIEAVSGLSSQGKRKVLRKLIGGLTELDRMIDQNQEKFQKLFKKRGVDFKSLSDEQREELIDKILHEE